MALRSHSTGQWTIPSIRRACGKSYIAVLLIILEGILFFMNLIQNNVFSQAGLIENRYAGHSIVGCVESFLRKIFVWVVFVTAN